MSRPEELCKVEFISYVLLIWSVALLCRVLEHISDDHEEGLCSTTCTQQHNYYYVRLNRSGEWSLQAQQESIWNPVFYWVGHHLSFN